MGGEREYAADPVSLEEFSAWYRLCLEVLAVAAGVALSCSGALRLLFGPGPKGTGTFFGLGEWTQRDNRTGRKMSQSPGRRSVMPLFFTAAFILGAICAPIVNRWSDRFLFTWPISLFAAQQGVIAALAWAGRRGPSGKGPWVSLLAVIGFLTTCLAYFELSRRRAIAHLGISAGLSPLLAVGRPSRPKTASRWFSLDRPCLGGRLLFPFLLGLGRRHPLPPDVALEMGDLKKRNLRNT